MLLQDVKAEKYEEVLSWLKEEGFENIQISELNDTLVISYENRVFRHEAATIAHIIKNIPVFDKIIAAIQNNGTIKGIG